MVSKHHLVIKNKIKFTQEVTHKRQIIGRVDTHQVDMHDIVLFRGKVLFVKSF